MGVLEPIIKKMAAVEGCSPITEAFLTGVSGKHRAEDHTAERKVA